MPNNSDNAPSYRLTRSGFRSVHLMMTCGLHGKYREDALRRVESGDSSPIEKAAIAAADKEYDACATRWGWANAEESS